MVSPTSCYQWGNFMIKTKSDAPFPYAVSEEWSEFSPEDAVWKKSDNLRIVCLGRETASQPVGSQTKLVGYTTIGFIKEIHSHTDSWHRLYHLPKASMTVIVSVCVSVGAVCLVGLVVVLVIRLQQKQNAARHVAIVIAQEKPTFKYKPLHETMSASFA